MHILIVDDEALARARLRTLLADVEACTGTGPHQISEAADARQAMAVLQAPGPRAVELALLDIHMPGQDGLALAHALRRLPLSEVLYLKAEQKYVTVRTVGRSYILDGALADLETRHADHLLRVHRNALVARTALRSLERHDDPAEGEGWALRLHGIPELLMVSRRQLPQVRSAIRDEGQPG
jgi:DNA-binding LytR/AlgR family response regulator